MPFTKRKRSARRRLSLRRKRRRFTPFRARSYGVPRRAPVPTTMATKMRYAERLDLQSVGGVPKVHIFSANGLYDPDITATGHQPRGFDNLVGVLWDHYTVIGAKITMRIANVSGSESILAGISLRDNSSAGTNPLGYLESDYTNHKILGSLSGDNSSTTIALKSNVPRFLGVSSPLSSENLRGDDSNNPTEQAYFHVWVVPTAGTATVDAEVQISIEWMLVLTEPKNPAQS